jgi:GMP synthase (glutamine-hydrolysing)
MDTIIVLDFGSQYAQLIARRIRELQVYSELHPHSAADEDILTSDVKGYILSGGPASVYGEGSPQVPHSVLKSGLPILGICYGMQALTHALGGQVAASPVREYGLAEIEVLEPSPLLLQGHHPVWMSHGDRIERVPSGFSVMARSENSPIAAMGNPDQKIYGLQFHPEVNHTPSGREILRSFVLDLCQVQPKWTPESKVVEAVTRVKEQVGSSKVLSAVSGGVDSTVATRIVHEAIGEQLRAVFVKTGLLRRGEAEEVVETFSSTIGSQFQAVDSSERFLSALEGVTDPEQKRRIIGELFIRIFEEQAQHLGNPPYLVQGTIYPDVVESSGPDRRLADRIKTHHNVGGLPRDMTFELVEPLRYLFKDEVREVGTTLGLPDSLIWRQPFPGPGLAVRCLGEVSFDRLQRLRAADTIVREELEEAGLLREATAQAFAVLLPVRSVGVMGDQRTYAETIAIRAVTTEDFMTADWARLPHDLLAQMSNRIVNEVEGVNRVVYDISSKPPATIEWE